MTIGTNPANPALEPVQRRLTPATGAPAAGASNAETQEQRARRLFDEMARNIGREAVNHLKTMYAETIGERMKVSRSWETSLADPQKSAATSACVFDALAEPDATAHGAVLCHCSEDDGVPDVGVSVGLGDGKLLWLGELRLNEGGDIGLVFLGPDQQRVVAPLWPQCEWQEAADMLRQQVGPALAAERDRVADSIAPAVAIAALEKIAAINPADLQEDNVLALCHAFLKARAAAIAAIAEIRGAA